MKHMCSVPVVMHPFAKIVLCICLKKGKKGVHLVGPQLPTQWKYFSNNCIHVCLIPMQKICHKNKWNERASEYKSERTSSSKWAKCGIENFEEMTVTKCECRWNKQCESRKSKISYVVGIWEITFSAIISVDHVCPKLQCSTIFFQSEFDALKGLLIRGFSCGYIHRELGDLPVLCRCFS